MIITDTIKNYALGASVAVIMGLSLSTWWLYGELDEAQVAAVQATEEKVNAQEAAKVCSRSVDKLLEEADLAAAKAQPKIDASKASERDHGTRAQEILKTTPMVGLSGCTNAANMGRKWLNGRKK